METGKKWLAILDQANYTWLESVVNKIGPKEINGSEIINAALDRARNDEAFEATLVEAQLKHQLQRLTDKMMAIEEAKTELMKKMSPSSRKRMLV